MKMIVKGLKKLLYLFIRAKDIDDVFLFDVLGKQAYLRNGIGFGFISDDYLYDNIFMEIGIGRVTSGYGDWGGGFSHATTCPLKITIDKNFIIQKVETDSFYNSDDSKEVEKTAKQLASKLKVGAVFPINDEEFKKHVTALFDIMPCKTHIGHDVFAFPHMLKHYLEDKNVYKFRDPKSLTEKTEIGMESK